MKFAFLNRSSNYSYVFYRIKKESDSPPLSKERGFRIGEVYEKKKIITFIKKTPKWILQEQEEEKLAQERANSPQDIEKTPTLQELYVLAKKQTKIIQEMIATTCQEKGVEYVKWNILYANKEAKTNYTVFLKKALEENWGLEIMEAEKDRADHEKIHRDEKNKEREESLKKDEEIKRLNQQYHALPEERKQQLQKQALEFYLKIGVPNDFKMPKEMLLSKIRDFLKEEARSRNFSG